MLDGHLPECRICSTAHHLLISAFSLPLRLCVSVADLKVPQNKIRHHLPHVPDQRGIGDAVA
jgi:hypothetical protein